MEKADKGNGSQRAERLRVSLGRFSTELEHFKLCCIWAGCVQPHLVIIGLYSWPVHQCCWGARSVQADSVSPGARATVTMCVCETGLLLLLGTSLCGEIGLSGVQTPFTNGGDPRK